MRLIVRTFSRGIHELNQLDEETLNVYLSKAKKDSADVGCALQLAVAYFSALLWFALTESYGYSFGRILALQVGNTPAEYISSTVFIAGFFVMPWVFATVTRDIWLIKCVRTMINRVRCDRCNYSLLGLAINNEEGEPEVLCPECGNMIVLSQHNLTATDIDPTRVNS
jgi:hypothetical protein